MGSAPAPAPPPSTIASVTGAPAAQATAAAAAPAAAVASAMIPGRDVIGVTADRDVCRAAAGTGVAHPDHEVLPEPVPRVVQS